MTVSNPGSVLLVDDDKVLLEATAGLLRHEGFEVETFARVESALDAMRARSFEVLVTEVHVRERSGMDLVRHAAEAGLGTTAILITDAPSVESAVDALRLAAIDYVVKPFQPRELIARVRRGVETSRARRRISEARQHTDRLARMLDDVRMVLDTAGAVDTSGAPVSADGNAMPGLSKDERSALSRREAEVLVLLLGGDTPKEIASRLFISHHTVRNHIRSIYDKLGVHSRFELLRKVGGRRPSVPRAGHDRPVSAHRW